MSSLIARAPIEASVDAWVRLADYPPTVADLLMVGRSGWTRVLRAAATAAVTPPLALIAFLIPPHGETFFLAVGIGVYLIYREATTRYVVKSFRGSCPRCSHALTLKRGSRLTSARSVPCYGCHFNPIIEIGDGPQAKAVAVASDAITEER